MPKEEELVQVVTMDDYDTTHLEQIHANVERANLTVQPGVLQEEIKLKELDLDPFIRRAVYTDEDRAAVLKEMVKACEDIGFLVIKNHGVPTELIEKMYAGSTEFFRNSSAEEKAKLKSHIPRRGYMMSEDQQSEGVVVAPPPGGDIPDSQFIPKISSFEKDVNEYYSAMASLETLLLKMIAEGLNIDPEAMVNNVGNHKGLLQLNYYRKLNQKHDFEERNLGGHTDWGPLTILTQGTPGLHVLKDEKWYRVVTPRDKFVINLGDAMNRWTNGKFASTIHCVRCEDDVDRLSIPYFVAQAVDPSDTRPLIPLVKTGEDATFSEGSYFDFIQKKGIAFYAYSMKMAQTSKM